MSYIGKHLHLFGAVRCGSVLVWWRRRPPGGADGSRRLRRPTVEICPRTRVARSTRGGTRVRPGGPRCSLRRFVVRPGQCLRLACTANHRGEVALRGGLAAAIDKYEELPHGALRLATEPVRFPLLCGSFPTCETTSRTLDGKAPSARLVFVSAPPDLPDVVRRAFDVSRRAGFVSFCRNETGRLLATLAATRSGTLAEFGTGCGVGTAWLRSGIRDDARILPAELDPDLAGAASRIFEDDDSVEVLTADWSTMLDRGPFALLFLDSREPKDGGPDRIADVVEPGGV